MLVLPCPWCGPRGAEEFGSVGELAPRPDPRTAEPQQWRDYLYLRANRADWTFERWYHRMGCRRYLVVERHPVTNEVRTVGPEGP
ncbi:MAG: sarcosine oxidase subunit delta [Nocardioides sp.]